MNYLVTCGRGLETFVTSELSEKGINSYHILDEGKVGIFCFHKEDISLKFDTIISCFPPIDRFNEQYDFAYESRLFNLKLIEKLYTIIYYENISSIDQDEFDIYKLLEKMEKINYKNIMDIVLVIKKQNNNIDQWKQCSNPENCHAFIIRQKEKKEGIKKKRKFNEIKEENNFKEVNNERETFSEEVKNVIENIDDKTVLSSDKTFRVSCRIRGKWKCKVSPISLSKLLVEKINNINPSWKVAKDNPDLDIYINLNDTAMFVGASMTKKPLSLRPYIPHTNLRSTICHLMIKEAGIKEGVTILDPMCGVGTILLEAAMNFKNLTVIASDLDQNILEAARCNLRGVNNVHFILSSAAYLPLLSNSLNAVVCDFPFGKKHSVTSFSLLIQKLFSECIRVLRNESRIVLLVSSQQFCHLKGVMTMPSSLKLFRVSPVSLGLTEAYIVTYEIEKLVNS